MASMNETMNDTYIWLGEVITGVTFVRHKCYMLPFEQFRMSTRGTDMALLHATRFVEPLGEPLEVAVAQQATAVHVDFL